VRKLIWLAALALMLAPVPSAQADLVGQNDQEVQKVAEAILDSVLAGFNEGNYEKYAQYFDDTLKESISPKKFQQTRSNILNTMGRYQSRTYLGFLNQNRMTVVLWKGVFDKSEGDVLIKLVLSKRQNRTVVTGLWFQ